VEEGLGQLFGLAPTEPTAPNEPTQPGVGTAEELLAQAQEKFAAADAALEDGDLARYQQLEEEGRALVAQAFEQLAASGGGTTTTTTVPSAQSAGAR